MKKTKFISLTLSLALILTAFISVNMTSVSAAGVKATYDFDTTTPTFTTSEDAAAAVINANDSFNTTKALKVWSTAWDNNSQSCVVVNIDASDSSDITFLAGHDKGWNQKEPHYGIVYNGEIYWDSTGVAGNIYQGTHDEVYYPKGDFSEYSIVGHRKFYKFTGEFKLGDVENVEELVINANNVSNITGLAFKMMNNIDSGHLLVDDIKIYEAAPYDTTVDLSMVVGASLRIGVNNGIRYITNVDYEKVEQLEQDGYTVQMGTLIAPSDLLGANELTFALDSSKYVDVPTSGYYIPTSGSPVDGQIAGSIKVNLNKNIAREFVGRGYAKVFKDGVLVATYYATANDNVRSLKALSNAWINDADSYALLNEAQQVEITAWANA